MIGGTKVLAYLTERILQFSILKQLDTPSTLYAGGIRVGKPREAFLSYQRPRRGLGPRR